MVSGACRGPGASHTVVHGPAYGLSPASDAAQLVRRRTRRPRRQGGPAGAATATTAGSGPSAAGHRRRCNSRSRSSTRCLALRARSHVECDAFQTVTAAHQQLIFVSVSGWPAGRPCRRSRCPATEAGNISASTVKAAYQSRSAARDCAAGPRGRADSSRRQRGAVCLMAGLRTARRPGEPAASSDDQRRAWARGQGCSQRVRAVRPAGAKCPSIKLALR